MPYTDIQKRLDHHAAWARMKRKTDSVWRDNEIAQVNEYRKRYPEKYLLRNVRRRAKILGIVCTLEIADIKIPDICPVLKVPLFMGTAKDHRNAPSIDRIIPELGYVPGNVRIISHRANNLRSNGTAAELKLVAEDAARLEREQ